MKIQSNMSFAGQLMSTMHPNNVIELASINAAIRPAGASYRDDLVHRVPHHSSNPAVDEMLKETGSFMVYQENIMEFLVKFCGFSGSESDTIRRDVGRLVPFILEII